MFFRVVDSVGLGYFIFYFIQLEKKTTMAFVLGDSSESEKYWADFSCLPSSALFIN